MKKQFNHMKKGYRNSTQVQPLTTLSLSDEEKELIEARRKFKDIEPGTKDWAIVLFTDQLRLDRYKNESAVMKSVNTLFTLRNQIARLKVQILSGNIVELYRDGQTMTQDEVQQQIEHAEWLAKAELCSLPILLKNLRALVGRMDITLKPVFTQEEFNALVAEVETRVASFNWTMPYVSLEGSA